MSFLELCKDMIERNNPKMSCYNHTELCEQAFNHGLPNYQKIIHTVEYMPVGNLHQKVLFWGILFLTSLLQ